MRDVCVCVVVVLWSVHRRGPRVHGIRSPGAVAHAARRAWPALAATVCWVTAHPPHPTHMQHISSAPQPTHSPLLTTPTADRSFVCVAEVAASSTATLPATAPAATRKERKSQRRARNCGRGCVCGAAGWGAGVGRAREGVSAVCRGGWV